MSKTIEDRKKQMMRLMDRYSLLINDDSQWVLPYVWNIRYRKQQSHASWTHEFICYTNDIAFAAMLFTAYQLQELHQVVIIVGMQSVKY